MATPCPNVTTMPTASPTATTMPTASPIVTIPAKTHYGDPKCPCVGVAVSGITTVKIGNASYKGLYPAEIGSSCRDWDQGRYPGSCTGPDDPLDWCENSWCYVDPCNCEIDKPTTPSDYLPDATYEGKQIHFSYATCGHNNTYNTPPPPPSDCDEHTWDAKYGNEGCPCIGIDGVTGVTDAVLKDHPLPGEFFVLSGVYPADLGSSCAAWDEGNHPKCTRGPFASWCPDKWCYVDVDNCNEQERPEENGYLPGAKFQGKSMFYSYAACNHTNSYDR